MALAAVAQLTGWLLTIALMTSMVPAKAIPVIGKVVQQRGNQFPRLDQPAPASPAMGGLRLVAVGGRVPGTTPLLPAQALRAPILAQTTTDQHGDFRLNLPAGTVTLLLAVDGGYYLNSFDGVGHYSSVEVAPGLMPIVLRDDRHSLH
jgi:hypothetical protein